MFPIALDITRIDSGKRSHATAMREALRTVAADHLRRRIGKHFQDIPETRPGGAYGYAERNEKYIESRGRRQKKMGKPVSDAPLVFTGAQRNKLGQTSPNSVITATQYGATLRLPAAHAMKKKQWQELTAVSSEEVREMNVLANETYARILRERRSRKTKTRIT